MQVIKFKASTLAKKIKVELSNGFLETIRELSSKNIPDLANFPWDSMAYSAVDSNTGQTYDNITPDSKLPQVGELRIFADSKNKANGGLEEDLEEVDNVFQQIKKRLGFTTKVANVTTEVVDKPESIKVTVEEEEEPGYLPDLEDEDEYTTYSV